VLAASFMVVPDLMVMFPDQNLLQILVEVYGPVVGKVNPGSLYMVFFARWLRST
jgi:hypothetical protein